MSPLSKTVFRVELYNLFTKGSKSPSNGWYVARVVNGCRHETVADCKGDEQKARTMVLELNAAQQ